MFAIRFARPALALRCIVSHGGFDLCCEAPSLARHVSHRSLRPAFEMKGFRYASAIAKSEAGMLCLSLRIRFEFAIKLLML